MRMKQVAVGLGIAFVTAVAGCGNAHGGEASGTGSSDPDSDGGHAGSSAAGSGSAARGGAATAGSSATGQAGGSSVDAGKAGRSSDAGSAGHTGDAGSTPAMSPAIPMKDGVPIGDCVDPTPEQLAATGCPATQPDPSSGCFVDPSVDCRYPIKVQGEGLSSQLIFRCERGTWDPGSTEWCGQTCDVVGVNGNHPIELPIGSCPERALAECDDGKGTMYAHDPSALTLTIAMLQSALEACNASIAGNAVTLELDNGCPKRLSSGAAFDVNTTKCLVDHFGSVRWKCATMLPCASFSWSATNAN
jgi:hypothetical protein